MKWIWEHKLISFLIAIILILLLIFVISVRFPGLNFGPFNLIRQGVNNVTGTLSKTTDGIEENVGGIFAYRKLQEENKKLLEENQRLKVRLTEQSLKKDELALLQSLSQALNYTSSLGITNVVSGSVTYSDGANWVKSFTIDVGKESGVEAGKTVINENGLIGIIEEAGEGWAKVSTITENSNRISFRVDGTDSLVGLTTGVENDVLCGYMLDENADVQVGSKIVTSGMGRYPAGFEIGTITKVTVNEISLKKELEIDTAVNFDFISKVVVII